MIKVVNLDRRLEETKEEYYECIEDICRREMPANGYYSDQVERFLLKVSGRKHAIFTRSGSIALLLSMLAYKIGPGDEVIITNYSCPASCSYVMIAGATPVFCEIDETAQMDAQYLESLVTSKTKAMVATGLYGDMHDHVGIKEFCDKHNLFYINDASQSSFASYKGLESLACGDMVAMSFADNKVVPTLGTAGAILTDSTEMFYNLLHLRKHGKPYRSSSYNHYGLNGIPDEDKAAQVLVSSRHYERWQNRRHQIAEFYDQEFEIKDIPVRPRPDYSEWNTHKYSVFFPDNFEAHALLKAEGIASEVHYPDGFATTGNYPNTDFFKKRALSIPINGHLTDSEVEIVANKVEKVWKNMNTKNS